MNKYLPVLFLITVFLTACSAIPTGGTAITNVTVIDGINGSRSNQTVIFQDDEITAVLSSTANFRVSETVDGTGKYLIPGLWDFHVHLTYDDRLTQTMPALFLSYGITSVRDTGGLLDKILPVVEAMRADTAIAPRVYFSGPLLDGKFVVYDGKSVPEIGVRNATGNEAKAMISDLKDQGVDFIKVYELVTPPVFHAMVEAANELNLPIDSHVPLSMLASEAGPLVDSIEHLRNIELDCASNSLALHKTRLERLENTEDISGYKLRSSLHKLQRLSAIADYSEQRCDRTLAALTSTTQVPTLRLNAVTVYPPYQRNGWKDAMERTPVSVQEEWAQLESKLKQSQANQDSTFADWSLFLTGRMHDKGIPIAAGTDTPIGLSVPGYSLHSELEMLVKAGLSPLDALRSATLRPAEYFSVQNELGSIEAGKKADMVLLDKNPLDDIRNTKSINAVISKGRLLNASELLEMVQSSAQ
ncbi:MAG: amidohydrolase family protein [Oceanicoccus sp.]